MMLVIKFTIYKDSWVRQWSVISPPPLQPLYYSPRICGAAGQQLSTYWDSIKYLLWLGAFSLRCSTQLGGVYRWHWHLPWSWCGQSLLTCWRCCRYRWCLLLIHFIMASHQATFCGDLELIIQSSDMISSSLKSPSYCVTRGRNNVRKLISCSRLLIPLFNATFITRIYRYAHLQFKKWSLAKPALCDEMDLWKFVE